MDNAVAPLDAPVASFRRSCWVCFATEADDPHCKWVQPCRCKGTTKWVHVACLQRWFDEKQGGNPAVQVNCPQCNTEYLVRYPDVGYAVLLIDKGWKLADRVCSMLTGSFVAGSMYWTAVTFGAVSLMQTMGHKRGLEIMEQSDPVYLLLGLPTIPLALLLVEAVPWEDLLIAAWRKQSLKWWIYRKLFGALGQDSARHLDDSAHHLVFREAEEADSGPMNMARTTRVVCGALMLPTFATACGNHLFGHMESPVKRTVLGGSVFLLFRGLLKMYYMQQQYSRLAGREIDNFNENEDEELPSFSF